MKKFFNKLSFLTLVLFIFSSVTVFANENTYQGYSEEIKTSSNKTSKLLRINDGIGKDGKDNIVYCYDLYSAYPNSYNSDNKTYYKRIETYLNSSDELTDKYGEDKKEKIAIVLKAGYPNDALGYMKKYGVSENDAMYMTQDLIWRITQKTEVQYTKSEEITENMAKYGNELLKLSKRNVFEQGKLSLEGKLEFTQRGEWWCTDKLSTIGDKGVFRFNDIPSEFEIIDWNTDKKIVGNLSVGQEFYIKSSSKPSSETKFELEYEYETVKIYFYKCLSGKDPYSNKNYQNLIRSESTNKKNKIELEIKINGNFEIPGIGGITPNLPGEEGTTPQLPGDSGLGGITLNLPENILPQTGGTNSIVYALLGLIVGLNGIKLFNYKYK